jgi:hypothetical protein
LSDPSGANPSRMAKGVDASEGGTPQHSVL